MLLTGAIFSEDRIYRYDLWRVWDERKPVIAFIGLNPSTADETKDDPTIRRCIGYAMSWGYGCLHMLNIFAFRSTDPKGLRTISDPVGPENNTFIKELTSLSGMVIVAWGSHGKYLDRGYRVADMIKDPKCLKINKDGEPSHPLYLKKSLMPVAYTRSHREKEG